MSGCTITVSNSVRTSAPVGQASRQPAFVQCLQTSDMNSQRSSAAWPSASATPTRATISCSATPPPAPPSASTDGIAPAAGMFGTWPPSPRATAARASACRPGEGARASTKRTWRHVAADSVPVWSYEPPLRNWEPSAGRSFHCLQATSHALQPMHTVVSVKKPMRRAPGLTIESSLMLGDLGGVVAVGSDARGGVADAGELLGARRLPAGAHAAHERLGLVDRRVGVAGEQDQVVGRTL